MTAGKRQPPLWLDISFAEALERFAGTDPKEVAQLIERAKEQKPPGSKPPGGLEDRKIRKPSRDRKRKPQDGA